MKKAIIDKSKKLKTDNRVRKKLIYLPASYGIEINFFSAPK